jgi:asparagine synthase (glutamine-hydrolysing)
MCGISGVYAFNDIGKEYIKKLPASAKTLSRRGPDAEGFFYNDGVGLAHRRLSVIDTSSSANQPMMDVTGRYAIIFNGEILNFKELIVSKLSEKPHVFHTSSDTEVLLQLYISYGKECLNWLKGFFAFAIYDKQENELFIARDNFGKKPLLIYQDNDKFLFASEMKALIAFGIPQEIDYTSLYQYFQSNYIPPPASIFKGVQKLLQGHCLYIKNASVTIEQYYKVELSGAASHSYSYEGAQAKLVELMEKAMERRLISDVPLGAFLSGGIDSSVTVALASRHINHLNTFSIGYKDSLFYDETNYAKLVAKKYNVEHTVFSLGNDDLLDHVFEVLDYIDEPFADSSCIPMYILCKKSRKTVTVALSGDGADEVFTGYNKHMAEFLVRKKSLAAKFVSSNKWLWDILPKSRSNRFGNLVRQLDRFAEGSRLNVQDRYYHWSQFNTQGNVMSLLTPQVQQRIDQSVFNERKADFISQIKGDNDFNEILLADMSKLLPGNMLHKVDMMSMANSLEVRCPFLDIDVVNFAFSLPQEFKINGHMKKRIVQDAFKDLLPKELYNRPKKGFDVPLLEWFRKELFSFIFDNLLSEKYLEEQGIFNVESIRKMKQQLLSVNGGDITAKLWAIVVFQYWYKKNIT